MKKVLPFVPLLFLLACEGKRDTSGAMARIDGTTYTQNDFQLLIKSLPKDRQDEILRDPEARRKHFEDVLRQKLLALAAQKAGYTDNAVLKERLITVDQRIVTQNYFQVHLNENGGFPFNEIESYYKAHSKSFIDDSGKVKPLANVQPMVVDSLIIAKANLDSFYLADGKKFESKASCDISGFVVASSKAAEQAIKAIDGGLAFEKALNKFSTDSLLITNKGKIARITQGTPFWEFGNALNTDSLFFNDKTKLALGKFTKPIRKDSIHYYLVKADSCRPATIPPLAQVRRQVQEAYLAHYRGALGENALAILKAKYNVKISDLKKPINDADLNKYYGEHKDHYLTAETYDVYHIELKNKDALLKKTKSIKTLEDFKKLAGQISENTWTKSKQGYMGLIKKDHCLPYGIGMLPSLFADLDSVKNGFLKKPFANAETRKWNVFWVTQINGKKEKPFDRAKAMVKQDYVNEQVSTIKPDDTLASFKGGKVILEKNVAFLRQEIPANVQERYTREMLVDYLLTWDLATLESEALGLTQDLKLQATRLQNQDSYWATQYQDSVINKTFGLDTLLLKKTFTENHNYFTNDSADHAYLRYSKDIATFLELKPQDFDLEYHINSDKYKHDSVTLSMQQAQYDMFQNIKGEAAAKADEQILARLKKQFHVEILDPSLLPSKPKSPNDKFKQAQNLHYDRKLDLALVIYKELRSQFPEMKGLQDSICFGMAQIYIEQENFSAALAEYRRLSYLYPESADNYKAQFMLGFIYAEHLKQDSSAVRAFETMLQKYPKTDLSDDADWMIRNIRSGGKLMPQLEGESSTKDTVTVPQVPQAEKKEAKKTK